jgi:Putative auto-transporter adhesin, head GIN domain
MKKIIIIIVCAVLTLPSFSQKINDPDAEVREVKNFHGIKVGDAFDVYLSQSDEEAVAVSGSDKDKKYITTEVKNGILYIRLDTKGVSIHWGNRKLKAYISFKQINQLDISGACNIIVAGTIKSDQLSVKLSGASDFKGKLDIDKMAVDISGASDMIVNGKATQLYIDASGASKFKGFDMITETCDVKGSGASDIKVTVNRELSAHVSGATDVRYKGDGVIKEIKSSGSSSISKG